MTLYVFDNPNLTNTTTNLLDKQTQQHLKKLHQKGLIKTIPHKSTPTLKTINTTTYTGLTQQTTPYNPLPTNKPNGHTAISLFAGAGGSALGLEKAGYTIHQCYELDKTATTTLNTNRPTWNTTPTDITTTNFTHLHGTIDLIEGGFPCQPFSHAGNRQGLNDTRGTLFHHYLRAIHTTAQKFITHTVQNTTQNWLNTHGTHTDDWNLNNLWKHLHTELNWTPTITPQDIHETYPNPNTLTAETITNELTSEAEHHWKDLTTKHPETITQDTREAILQTIDQNWTAHLANLDYLKDGIGLRALAQKDPKIEYKIESAELFDEMNEQVKKEFTQLALGRL